MPLRLHKEFSHSTSHLLPPPNVFLLDIDGLTAKLEEVICQAAEYSRHRKLSADLSKTLSCPKFRGAFREALLMNDQLVADPRSAPQYSGPAAGNPATFFFLHYRLRIEAGGYYQTDLQRDSPRLFNALRNLLNNRYFRDRFAEADREILAAGFEPVIKGVRIKDVTDLAQLLPARRGIEPRVPDRTVRSALPLPVRKGRSRIKAAIAAE